MAQDYYSDAAPAAAPAEEPATPKEEASDSQVAELPLSVFPEKPKVGDVCSFEVTQLSENSAIVRYASESSEEETEAPEPAPAPSGGQGGPMTSMLG